MRGLKLLFLALGLVVVSALPVLAQYSSTNFKVEEYFFGSGGELDASSTNYRARGSLGDLGIGLSASTNYQLYGGIINPNTEFIELTVNTSSVDLGLLSTSSTKTGSASFTVSCYLCSGYVVTTEADPPTNNTDTLNPLTSGGTSTIGTEQFGINLVANTSPTTFGANVVQTPDSTFSFGYAATGYATTNNYRYNRGDTIARSDSASGRSTYTLSYIANISDVTSGGEFVMNHILVATATY